MIQGHRVGPGLALRAQGTAVPKRAVRESREFPNSARKSRSRPAKRSTSRTPRLDAPGGTQHDSLFRPPLCIRDPLVTIVAMSAPALADTPAQRPGPTIITIPRSPRYTVRRIRRRQTRHPDHSGRYSARLLSQRLSKSVHPSRRRTRRQLYLVQHRSERHRHRNPRR